MENKKEMVYKENETEQTLKKKIGAKLTMICSLGKPGMSGNNEEVKGMNTAEQDEARQA